MRDLSLLLILTALASAAFYRPWLGVLGLAVVGYMAPHAYGDAMAGFPAYLALLVATTAAMALRRQWRPPPLDWRLGLLLGLWAWFLVTTLDAMAPYAAWPKFLEVSKSMAPLLLTLLLIDTREKLYYLIVTIACAIALVTLKGSYWALMTGFADRVYGPPHSQYYGNNAFAVMVCMNIPLLVLWLRQTRHAGLRWVLMVTIALSVAAALSSWSRGGMLALLATALLLTWQSRRKALAITLLVIALAFAWVGMPEQWHSRMESVTTYETDDSAQGRLRAWRAGLSYALRHPYAGGGFEGWQHVLQGDIDWHSSYVEILVEHGFVGLALWSALLLATLYSLARLARMGARQPELAWARQHAMALGTSLAAYAAGSLFLGITYWDILFHMIVISVLLRRFALQEAAVTLPSAPRMQKPE